MTFILIIIYRLKTGRKAAGRRQPWVLPVAGGRNQMFLGRPVAVRLYADGLLWHQQTITGPFIIRPPDGKVTDKWSVEISSAQRVVWVRLAVDVDDLQTA